MKQQRQNFTDLYVTNHFKPHLNHCIQGMRNYAINVYLTHLHILLESIIKKNTHETGQVKLWMSNAQKHQSDKLVIE